MPTITLIFGLLLIVIGVAGYVLTGASHLTALIPAAFGVVVVALAALAHRERWRKHAMHAVVVVAVVGLAGTARALVPALALMRGETVDRPEAVIARATMALLCIVFIALAVAYFIRARRARLGR